MRVIGKRTIEKLGLRSPTAAEIAWTVDTANRAPRIVPKGVYQYRSHEDADADMQRWKTDAVVERFQELAARKY